MFARPASPPGVRRRKRTIATISVSTVLSSSRSRQLSSTWLTTLQRHQHPAPAKAQAPANERAASAEEAQPVATAKAAPPPVSMLAPDPVRDNLDGVAIFSKIRIGSNSKSIAAAAAAPRPSASALACSAEQRSSDCSNSSVKCDESLSSLSASWKYPKRICRKTHEVYLKYSSLEEDNDDEDVAGHDEDEDSNYRNEDQGSEYDDDDDELNRSDDDCDKDEDDRDGDGDDQVDEEDTNKDNDSDNESTNGKKQENNSPATKRNTKHMKKRRSKEHESDCEDEGRDGDHTDQVDDEARNKDNDSDNDYTNDKKHENNSPAAKRKTKSLKRRRSKEDESDCEDEGRDGDQVDDEARKKDGDRDNDSTNGKKHENNSPAAERKTKPLKRGRSKDADDSASDCKKGKKQQQEEKNKRLCAAQQQYKAVIPSAVAKNKGQKLNQQWHKNYEKLKEFKRKTGHCNVPRKSHRATPLSNWVNLQRAKYLAGRLPVDRLKALNRLNFQWVFFGSRESHWYKMFDHLKAFKEKFGHFNVKVLPSGNLINDRLHEWIRAQRTAYKANKLPPDRIEAMESIDFIWEQKEPSHEMWMSMYLELKAYKEKHGHIEVKPGENRKLNKWIQWQQSCYRKNKLSEQSQILLAEIGFDYSYKIFQWKDRFKLLKEFYSNNGHFRIPIKYKVPGLQQWASNQRRALRENTLTEEKKEALQSVGFK